MSARKDRQIKATMKPLIEEVQKYIETKNNDLGFVEGARLKVKAHYDRVKNETQLIFTFINKGAKEAARNAADIGKGSGSPEA